MRDKELFLPDFCHIRSVFAVVVIGELLAFVLVLARPGQGGAWQSLGIVSLFVQWITLSSAALLCLLRPALSRLGNRSAAAVCYGLILLLTAAISALGDYYLHGDTGAARYGFTLRMVAVAAIVAALALRYFYIQHQWKQRVEAEAAARIEALQARIRPHFLFNSLNTIASLIGYDPTMAEAAVEDLSDLFRASLAKADRLVPFAEELALSEGYLRTEALRLDKRLQVDWQLRDFPDDALIPPLTLQPLLENAVYYGIEPWPDGGRLNIEGWRTGTRLHITICNPQPPETGWSRRQGMGMAQANVRERLRLAFGGAGSLAVHEKGDTYEVELEFPEQRAAT